MDGKLWEEMREVHRKLDDLFKVMVRRDEYVALQEELTRLREELERLKEGKTSVR